MAETGDIDVLDAETGDMTEWTSTTVEAGNSAAADADAENHGVYGFNFSFGGTAGSNFCYAEKTFAESTTVYARAYINFTASMSFPLAAASYVPFSLVDGANDVIYIRVGIAADGETISWSRVYYRTDAGMSYSAIAGGVNRDQWYRVEFYYKTASGVGAGDGAYECKVDGVSFASGAALDNDTVIVDRTRAGGIGAVVPDAGSEFWVDDIKINNATSGWPGAYSDTSAGLFNYRHHYEQQGQM